MAFAKRSRLRKPRLCTFSVLIRGFDALCRSAGGAEDDRVDGPPPPRLTLHLTVTLSSYRITPLSHCCHIASLARASTVALWFAFRENAPHPPRQVKSHGF